MSDEGGVVAVPKVNGEDTLRKLFDLLHDEAFPAFGPADDVRVLVVLSGGGVYL